MAVLYHMDVGYVKYNTMVAGGQDNCRCIDCNMYTKLRLIPR